MKMIMAALAVLWLGMPAFAAIGSGKQSYRPTFDGVRLTIYTYRPSCSNPSILFSLHGTSRNADDYRDHAIPRANAMCAVVIAPLFDSSRFPTDDYQRGGIVDSNDNLQQASEWTTRFMPLIINWARTELGDANKPVWLFGHSAGGQFLSRVAAYQDMPSGVQRYVVANPSTHVVGSLGDPNVEDRPPYGFRNFPNGEVELQEYLARPVTIYLGENDTDANDSSLGDPNNELGQGRHRRERGENVFGWARDYAASRGWSFNWRIVIAPNVAHSASGMLNSTAAAEAFEPGPAPDPDPEPDPDPCECPCECQQ